ncbi:putative bZIP transcription factor [Pseudoalteromonas virus vB_PspP-H6/1]|nr:putative bZIP transcription factor [Pseudoalteromonas virus vB_PspP-H6/1]
MTTRLEEALGFAEHYQSLCKEKNDKIDHLRDRVKELEQENETLIASYEYLGEEYADLQHSHALLEINRVTERDLNKFALEQKVIGAKDFHRWIIDYPEATIQDEDIQGYIEQLRKGGGS